MLIYTILVHKEKPLYIQYIQLFAYMHMICILPLYYCIMPCHVVYIWSNVQQSMAELNIFRRLCLFSIGTQADYVKNQRPCTLYSYVYKGQIRQIPRYKWEWRVDTDKKLEEIFLMHKCAADFTLLNLPKGKSLGRSKPELIPKHKHCNTLCGRLLLYPSLTELPSIEIK